MIELQMVKRMARRGLMLAPILIAALWIAGGPEWALSGAIGLGMTLLNLFISARLIGGVAEKNPLLLMPVAMATYMFGLLILTGIALVLRALEVGYFPVIGITLVGSHLGLVLWEAAGAHNQVENPVSAIKARSV